jgi:amino acid permease
VTDGGPIFRRDQLLGGLPAKRASTLLYAIERRTSVLVGQSRAAMASYRTTHTEEDRDKAFMVALAAGREATTRPSPQDLERYAPRWADLVPPDVNLRAALARLIGQSYRLSARHAPQLRAALGLDDPAVAVAFQKLHEDPLAGIWAPSLSPREQLAWWRSRTSDRIEHLPPFWMAFALTFTETVGAGILALPVALAGLGAGPALVLLLVMGLVNILTVGALVEGITRNGQMRYGTAYLGRLVSETLGRSAAGTLGVALWLLNIFTLLAAYIGFGSVLEGSTGIPALIWIVGLFAVNGWIVWRGSLDATVASAVVIGIVNIVLIAAIALLAIPFMSTDNLTYANVPLLDGRPLDASVLQLVFGVVLMAYFGHTSAANAAKVVLERDPSGRGLLWGNMAALAAVTLVYGLATVAIIGAVGPDALVGIAGTAITPLAAVVGPVVNVLGSIFAVLAIGLGTIYFALGMSNQVLEWLPPVRVATPGTGTAGAGTGTAGAGTAPARRGLDDPLVRRILAVLPTAAVFVLVESLLLAGAASFTEPFGIIGVLTVPLLGGIFPMLIVAAARRRGEYVPGHVVRLIGARSTVIVISLLFLAAVFVHALFIWDGGWDQVAALAVGIGMAVLMLRIATGGSFRGRTVLELRRTAAGETRGLVAEGRQVEAGAGRASDSLVTAVPGDAPRDLLVWAHLVTPEGHSVGLAGDLELADPPASLTLDQDGRAVASLAPGEVTVRLRVKDRELSAG